MEKNNVVLICRSERKTLTRFEFVPAEKVDGPAGRYRVTQDRRVKRIAGNKPFFGLKEALDMVGVELARALGAAPPQPDPAPKIAKGDRVRVATGNVGLDGAPLMERGWAALDPHQEIDGRWYVVVRTGGGLRKAQACEVVKEVDRA
jgi:hypothetical protein